MDYKKEHLLVMIAIRKEHPNHSPELMQNLVELSTRVMEDEHFFEYHTPHLLEFVRKLHMHQIDFGIAFPKSTYARV